MPQPILQNKLIKPVLSTLLGLLCCWLWLWAGYKYIGLGTTSKRVSIKLRNLW